MTKWTILEGVSATSGTSGRADVALGDMRRAEGVCGLCVNSGKQTITLPTATEQWPYQVKVLCSKVSPNYPLGKG